MSTQPLSSKQTNNPKIVQMKLEIEQIFSKSSTKPNNFASLLHSLDNSFSKQREQRKNDQLKTQKKLAILSQELKKFNEKSICTNITQNLRPTAIENPKENSNSKQNFQNFSFAKEKSEKPLDFFLNLINSQRTSDIFTVKQSIYLKESSQPKEFYNDKNKEFYLINNDKNKEFYQINDKNQDFCQTYEKSESFILSQSRAKTPDTSSRNKGFLSKRPAFDFRCFSSHQKLAKPRGGDFSELSKKLGKRMFTFGLDYEIDKRKNSHFCETKISELNLSSERTGVMSTKAENTLELERNGHKSSLLERTGALSTKAENTTQEIDNRYKGSILDIARKISGNLEELVGRLGRPGEGDTGERNEDIYERKEKIYQKSEELEAFVTLLAGKAINWRRR